MDLWTDWQWAQWVTWTWTGGIVLLVLALVARGDR